jgi:hypothetical protein
VKRHLFWRLIQTRLFIRDGIVLGLLGWMGGGRGRSVRALSSEKLTPATQRQG